MVIVPLSDGTIRTAMKNRLASFPSMSAWAAHIGVGQAYLSQVYHGHKRPGDKILEDLGMERQIVVVMSQRK